MYVCLLDWIGLVVNGMWLGVAAGSDVGFRSCGSYVNWCPPYVRFVALDVRCGVGGFIARWWFPLWWL